MVFQVHGSGGGGGGVRSGHCGALRLTALRTVFAAFRFASFTNIVYGAKFIFPFIGLWPLTMIFPKFNIGLKYKELYNY